jgi:hypothetical protein
MASNIDMAMSDANGNGTHGCNDDDAKASNGDADDIKGESKLQCLARVVVIQISTFLEKHAIAPIQPGVKTR